MTISFKVFPEFELLVTKYSGAVTGAQLLETYQAACAEEGFRPGMNELVLLAEVSDLDVDLKTLAELAEMTTDFHQGRTTRSAIVGSEPKLKVSAKLYQSMAEVGESELVAVFEELTEALAWLGRTDFPVECLDEVT